MNEKRALVKTLLIGSMPSLLTIFFVATLIPITLCNFRACSGVVTNHDVTNNASNVSFFNVLFFCRPTSRSTVSSSKQPASNFEEIVKRPDSNPRPEVDDTAVSKPTATRSLWEVAWEAHKYFSGTLFVLLAIYCSVNILRLHTFSR